MLISNECHAAIGWVVVLAVVVPDPDVIYLSVR